MKLKSILLLVVPLLLTSCDNGPIVKGTAQTTKLSLEETITIVEGISDTLPTGYTIPEGRIHIGKVPADAAHGTLITNRTETYKESKTSENPYDPTMKWGISENLTDGKVFGSNLVSSSYYFGAPLRLKAYPFYTTKEDNKGNVSLDVNGCVYGYFRGIFVYSGSNAELELFKNADGNLVISVYNAFTYLTVYNVNFNVANYSGRINAEFTYDLTNGLLTSEKIWSNNFNGKNYDEPSVLYLESTYTNYTF